MDVKVCEKCNTPLEPDGRCVTCAAAEEGLVTLTRSGYVAVREMVDRLEEAKLHPEIEKVPPRREEEKKSPLWNLYAPEEEVQAAVEILRKDWAELLADPDAQAAAQRGAKEQDLDAGGELECPACGTRFKAADATATCPECGLVLGVPTDASPEEGE